MKTDGNLVLRDSSNVVCWQTQFQQPAAWATYQKTPQLLVVANKAPFVRVMIMVQYPANRPNPGWHTIQLWLNDGSLHASRDSAPVRKSLLYGFTNLAELFIPFAAAGDTIASNQAVGIQNLTLGTNGYYGNDLNAQGKTVAHLENGQMIRGPDAEIEAARQLAQNDPTKNPFDTKVPPSQPTVESSGSNGAGDSSSATNGDSGGQGSFFADMAVGIDNFFTAIGNFFSGLFGGGGGPIHPPPTPDQAT